MNTAFYIKLYLCTVPVFFAIDLIWLGGAARSFYAKHLGELLRPQVNWAAAIVFYLLFIGGILYFAVAPALARDSLQVALLNGALFGLISYATYDLTNLATLKGWPTIVVAVDIAWGTILCAAVSAASWYIGAWLR